jgi:GDPmannose 4,6-dehydratase
MMQHKNPEDWVLATGESHTVEEFAKLAFQEVGMNWEDHVVTSEKYYRPNEVDYLLGSPKKAEENLGWKIKTTFPSLVSMMVESDLLLAKREQVLLKEGLLSPTWEHPKNL